MACNIPAVGLVTVSERKSIIRFAKISFIAAHAFSVNKEMHLKGRRIAKNVSQ